MPDARNNVLLPMAMPTQSSLRSAVGNMIRDIQRDNRETDQDTADKLGVSKGTIVNARNGATDLNALTIARIGAVYGSHYVDPYHALYGATASPVQKASDDPLCHLARAVSTICDMRCPDGPGGMVEMPKEKLDALPTLRAARASLDAYIAGIEKLRLVA